MDIYIYKDKKYIQLPVLPTSYSKSEGQNNTTVSIDGGDDLNFPGSEKLAEIELTCCFPGKESARERVSHQDPYDLVGQLREWRTDKTPVRLVITETDVDMDALIIDMEYGEEGGNRDVNYTLRFQEYRTYQAVIKKSTSAVTDTETALSRGGFSIPAYYIVTQNDIDMPMPLFFIAKKVTGDSANWRAIYELNKSTIGADWDAITVGMTLIIPSLAELAI